MIFPIDFLDGFIRSFPPYLRKFQPKKSKPSSIWVVWVFSSDNSRPRSVRNSLINSASSFAVSSESAVTTKSSAYLTKFTLCGLYRVLSISPFLPTWYTDEIANSIPSSVIFASIGEIIPPWGVPAMVGFRCRLYTNPALRNCFRVDLSIGILFRSQSWLILSKQPLISPSRTHFAEYFPPRQQNAYWRASCVLLCILKPNERGSAVVSAIGCSARAYSACIALSCMVGIPKGRFFVVPGFGI